MILDPATTRFIEQVAALPAEKLAVIFDEETAGFPCIDCARVHIDAIVERLAA